MSVELQNVGRKVQPGDDTTVREPDEIPLEEPREVYEFVKKQVEKDIEERHRNIGVDPEHVQLVKEFTKAAEKKNRKCRDVLCLIIFSIVQLGVVGVGVFGYLYGNPYRLYYGYDYNGTICGRGDAEQYGAVFYPSPLAELSGSSSAVCIHQCPTEWGEVVCRAGFNYSLMDTTTRAAVLLVATDFAKNADTWIEEHNPGFLNTTDGSQPTLPCSTLDSSLNLCPKYFSCDTERVFPPCFLGYPSREGLNRCVPDTSGVQSAVASAVSSVVSTAFGNSTLVQDFLAGVTQIIEDPTAFLNNMASKLQNNWIVLTICVGVTILVAFLWLLLIRLIAAVVTWVTIIVLLISLIGVSLICWVKTGHLQPGFLDLIRNNTNIPFILTEVSDDYATMMTIAIVMTVLTVLAFLITCGLGRHVNLAIKLLIEASKAIREMPAIIFYPLISLIFSLIAVAFFALVGAFIVSAGNWDCYEGRFKWSLPIKGMIGLCVVGFIWMLTYVEALEEIIFAGAVVRWYTVVDKKLLKKPLWRSFTSSFVYHSGTAAVGSAIITIVTIIRIVMTWVMRRMRKFNKNLHVKFIITCLACCMKCFDRLLRFINRNAYIQVAIHGKGFCRSAKNACLLLIRNVLRVGAITAVSAIFIFLGKVYVSGFTTFVGAIGLVMNDCSCVGGLKDALITVYTNGTLSEVKSSTLECWDCVSNNMDAVDPLTLIVIFLLSFFIASEFMETYSISIDTLFQCYCEDVERIDLKRKEGVEEKMLAPASLKNIIDKNKPKVAEVRDKGV
mmetsp:Transcript_43400/g.112898  ORF Transcript_43400/g.112898 Transcript_43400/m.112898 type:complete len:782 (-) Transcript_43400:413-2758(-)|eukprot:CAMPEP_0113901152 /NCGR_PEP_ID=MMETSP0780_2-20120614/21087_1 /TAXON_ID=652834 /ORGANISM="Palpitomonas bilix" /LENGTH=781 /DNA_ID=CAMNT_0000893717 /DNA_START=39 /DNA_END=2384 /DNA_ORIENTATION=- /assembly_acc=CAM_ASM_000599